MTYTTTHLGIATILIYLILPKHIKDYLKTNPGTFFLITLGAVIPDLDIFTNGHRAYGHSVFYPIIIILFAPLLSKLKPESNDLERNIRLFGLFWFTHLLYDTTFGPVAFLFPLDTRFYDINMGIAFDLAGAGIIPLGIKGLFVDVNIIDQSTGTDTFFVNWTPEERFARFGTYTLRWVILDFVTHSTLFLIYFFMVVYPIVKRGVSKIINSNFVITMSDKLKTDREINISPTNFIKRYKLNTTLFLTPFLLLILASTSFIAGPMGGKVWVDEQTTVSSLYIKHDDLQLLAKNSFRVPDNAELDLTVKSSGVALNYTVFVTSISENNASRVISDIEELISMYRDRNITFSELLINYQNYLLTNISIIETDIQNVNPESTGEWTLESIDKNYILLSGLYDWNLNESFSFSFVYEASWTVTRNNEYRNGLILGIISLIGSILTTIRILRTNDFPKLLSE